ncbi:hypothetical protein HPB51_024052 [Rhipicephalus microplus]|uniref:Uncharacterized protein n=1 Tax=Rhipicephalus microplus TaxID=6941 RepID=A0A9J6ECQ1_RHIMP|nr:hypothetical protein HPB51_024052 [Rhipicephalus microplus]
MLERGGNVAYVNARKGVTIPAVIAKKEERQMARKSIEAHKQNDRDNMAPSSACTVVYWRHRGGLVFLLVTAFLSLGANADRPTKSAVYYMDDLCGSAHTATITVGVAGLESAVVLRATKHHIDHDFNCTVNVTTRVDRSLLYSISFLDLPMTCLSYLEVLVDNSALEHTWYIDMA